MIDETFNVKLPPKPIGQLEHEPTHSVISVYHKINWFRRIMLKLCFDLDYRKLYFDSDYKNE